MQCKGFILKVGYADEKSLFQVDYVDTFLTPVGAVLPDYPDNKNVLNRWSFQDFSFLEIIVSAFCIPLL